MPKQVIEEEEVEVSEDLTRLGFRNDNGKWSRTAPRTGARTVVIEGSRGRTLEVKATTETDLTRYFSPRIHPDVVAARDAAKRLGRRR